MADLLTPQQLIDLLDLEAEIINTPRPTQTRYSEDVVRRLAKILAPATGIDVQVAIDAARDNPWTMWVALIAALDDEATGYIFQEYASWTDWGNVILPALRDQHPEKPGVPPEWLVRRIARILDLELPILSLAFHQLCGMGTEEAFAEQPLFAMLLVIDYIAFFYSF